MKNITRKAKNVFTVAAGALIVTTVGFVSDLLAAGGPSTGPYGYYHQPEDTGFITDNSTMMYIAGAALLYGIGLAFLSSSEALKRRISNILPE